MPVVQLPGHAMSITVYWNPSTYNVTMFYRNDFQVLRASYLTLKAGLIEFEWTEHINDDFSKLSDKINSLDYYLSFRKFQASRL